MLNDAGPVMAVERELAGQMGVRARLTPAAAGWATALKIGEKNKCAAQEQEAVMSLVVSEWMWWIEMKQQQQHRTKSDLESSRNEGGWEDAAIENERDRVDERSGRRRGGGAGKAGGWKGVKYERRKPLWASSGCPLAAKRGGGGVSLLKLRKWSRFSASSQSHLWFDIDVFSTLVLLTASVSGFSFTSVTFCSCRISAICCWNESIFYCVQ